VTEIEEHRGLDLMETAGRLIHFAERHGVDWENVFVDVIGVGAGVVDRLHEQDRYVYEVTGCHRMSGLAIDDILPTPILLEQSPSAPIACRHYRAT